MRIDILTLFPEMMECVLKTSILGRAVDNKIIDIHMVNIRDYSLDKHHKVDDYPFGGGSGMVMTPQPVFDALRAIQAEGNRIIYLSPKGKQFHQDTAIELSKEERIIFLCGHYEGLDQRIIDYWVTDEISIGDYVLTGGEIPALAVIDSICRMVPGVLSHEDCYKNESIYSGLLEYPHYTRPREYEGLEVPDILLSGNHPKIDQWRMEKSLELTKSRRKDLYHKYMKNKKNI